MASIDFEKISTIIESGPFETASSEDVTKCLETIAAIRDGTYTGPNANAIMTILQACNSHVEEGNTFLANSACYAIARFSEKEMPKCAGYGSDSEDDL